MCRMGQSQGEAGRNVCCSMQAHDWVHGIPQFKLQGTKKLMFNDAMTMGACSERMQVAMFD